MKAGSSAASASSVGVGADALVAVDQNPMALFVAAVDRHDLAFELARVVSGGGLLMAAKRESVLSSREMPCVWARNSAVTPIISAPLRGAMEQLGVEVHAVVHRQVLHVFQPADDLHVFAAGHDGVRRLIERLQAAAAQSIDRWLRPPRSAARHQADRAGHVQPCSSVCCVLPSTTSSISSGSMPVRSMQCFDAGHGQIVAPDVAVSSHVRREPGRSACGHNRRRQRFSCYRSPGVEWLTGSRL